MAKKKEENSAKTASVMQWKGKDGDEKFIISYNASVQEALEEVRPHIRSHNSNIYDNTYSPSISIRDEFNRADYDNYRPGERLPTDDKGKIAACLDAYNKSGYGIVKNIVDLMADFAVQGIDVAYPNKKQEKIIKVWFNNIVKGPERSKRFANQACKTSNMIVKRTTAKIPLKVIRKFYKSTSKPNAEFTDQEVDTVSRELPIDYKFLHPLTVDQISPELSAFISNFKKRYSLRIPAETLAKINFPTEKDKELIAQIPTDIINEVRKGNTVIPLDPDKVDVYFYNKEDWEIWATPMIYTVLADLRQLEKLKLADACALDGAISQIRIWTIGDIEKGIKPTPEAMARLSQTLINAVGGGFLDLMWTEDLKFQEVASSVWNFLGETKYVPTLNAIYTGLGIPPLFTGSSNQGSFTNNYIAIKTMVERLEAIRNLIREFWQKEFEIVAKALGLNKPISITFDRMTLNDEASVLKLMLDLVDRGYLSIESVQEMVGVSPEIEDFRIKREWAEQKNKSRPAKVSPYHKGQWEEQYIDDFVKLGEIAPSQLGIELEPKKAGEIVPATRETKVAPGNGKLSKPKKGKGGRPLGVKDVVKRKQKEVKPRRSVNELIRLTMWAKDAQNKISETIQPIYLDSLSKKNLRQLTTDEVNKLERFKFGILASISPLNEISEDFIKKQVCEGELNVPEAMDMLLTQMMSDCSKNRELTLDNVRELQATVYAAYNLPRRIEEVEQDDGV